MEFCTLAPCFVSPWLRFHYKSENKHEEQRTDHEQFPRFPSKPLIFHYACNHKSIEIEDGFELRGNVFPLTFVNVVMNICFRHHQAAMNSICIDAI
jgi:hypothetical protein